MEALFFLKIKTNLQLTSLKIKNSRKELEVKHPDKKTFIKSMKESEEDINEALAGWIVITEEFKSMTSKLQKIHTENLQLKAKLDEVKKINDKMIDKLNL